MQQGHCTPDANAARLAACIAAAATALEPILLNKGNKLLNHCWWCALAPGLLPEILDPLGNADILDEFAGLALGHRRAARVLEVLYQCNNSSSRQQQQQQEALAAD